MKIGIVTFYRPINNGAVLQACATNRIVLNKLGVTSELIDYRLKRIEYYRKSFNLHQVFKRKGIVPKIKGVASCFLFLSKRIKQRKLFDKFIEKYLITSSNTFTGFDELKQTIKNYDAYIVGSDLVWNPLMTEGINPVFFLEFAENKKRIAYAPSIGTTDLDKAQLMKIASKSEKLDWISVREITSANQLQNYISKKIYTVLDPTLLTNEEDWCMFYQNKPIYNKKYIYAFSLERSDLFVAQVNALAQKFDYDIIVNGSEKGYHASVVKNVSYSSGPSEFLNYVKNAQIVVTNSFHGCAFSIIFHKDFYCIPHSTRGIRMTDLMKSLKLEDRIIQHKEAVCGEMIDYKNVENIRNHMINDSMDYLKRALGVEYYG